MNLAFLSAEIIKDYIDITISDEKSVIKNLVYFNASSSYEALLTDVLSVFDMDIHEIHCGFINGFIPNSHWLYSLLDESLNIKIHAINHNAVVNEIKKINDKNLTNYLVFNYLEANYDKTPQALEKQNQEFDFENEQNSNSFLAEKTNDKQILESDEQNSFSPFSYTEQYIIEPLIKILKELKGENTFEETCQILGLKIKNSNNALNQNIAFKQKVTEISEVIVISNPYFKQIFTQKIASKHTYCETIDFINFRLTKIIYSVVNSTSPIVDLKVEVDKEKVSSKRKKIEELDLKTAEMERKYLKKKSPSKQKKSKKVSVK